MSNQNIQARTLTQTAGGKLTKLSEVIESVAAEETATLQSQDICHKNDGDGGFMKSSYKKGGEKEKRRKYGHCGDQYHGQTITPKDREENCKPWSTMCSKCQKVHHFAKM